MNATLVLEDGQSFQGEALGAGAEKIGEVVFNTAVVGYQEMITDPANLGKILVLTYPLIGNYGTAPKFNQSSRSWLSGLVIKEKSRIYSNWQAKAGLEDFVKKENLLVLTGVDTRALAVHLRNKGEMLGVISTAVSNVKECLAKIEALRKGRAQSRLGEISVSKPKVIAKARAKYSLAVLDLGIARSALRQLEALGPAVRLLPYNTPAQAILRLEPHGLIISNGPEADEGLRLVTDTVAGLIGKVPILGVSTGHQVLACALGARIKKMKHGHRGLNYPVYRPGSYKAEITAQNHGFVVDADALSKVKAVKITAYNLNDRTVEEFQGKRLRLMGAQYDPVSPGCGEINDVFKKFFNMIKEN